MTNATTTTTTTPTIKKYLVRYEETIEDLSYTYITQDSLEDINADTYWYEEKIIEEIQHGTDGRLAILSIEEVA
jgi:hypothetical protein